MEGGGDPSVGSLGVRCRSNLVHSKTLDGGGGRGHRGRINQEDFLPRQAWTEEEEWEDPSDQLRGSGGGDTSTSDVTVSPSSSESYPECRF